MHFISFYRQKNLTKGTSTWLKELDKDVVLFLFDVCDDRSSAQNIEGILPIGWFGALQKDKPLKYQ